MVCQLQKGLPTTIAVDTAGPLLQELVAGISVTPKKRQPTRPSKSAKRKRMDSKTRRGQLKSLRGRIEEA